MTDIERALLVAEQTIEHLLEDVAERPSRLVAARLKLQTEFWQLRAAVREVLIQTKET